MHFCNIGRDLLGNHRTLGDVIGDLNSRRGQIQGTVLPGPLRCYESSPTGLNTPDSNHPSNKDTQQIKEAAFLTGIDDHLLKLDADCICIPMIQKA